MVSRGRGRKSGSAATWVEELLPEDWQATRVLHDGYFRDSEACALDKWQSWLRSPNRRLALCPPFSELQQGIHCKRQLSFTLERRSVADGFFAPQQSERSLWVDYDFAPPLPQRWSELAAAVPEVMASVVRAMIAAPPPCWRERLHAKVYQLGRVRAHDVSAGPIVAAWVFRLRLLPCFPDTNGIIRVPSDLYLRNRDIELLLGMEPFVHVDWDQDITKPLLEALGVCTRPAGVEKLLERLRALATVSEPKKVVSEIEKHYRALDQALTPEDPQQLEVVRQAFDETPLILTEAYGWARRGEVYLRPSEAYPDPPLIHPVVAELKFWRAIGVAEEPSPHAVLEWLSGLPSGVRLESRELEGVRKALGRFPREVWESVGHWLSVENTWVPVERLRYRVTMQTLVRHQELFTSVKESTANLTVVGATVYSAEPFAVLRDLNSVLEERPAALPKSRSCSRSNFDSESPSWLQESGRMLRRIVVSEDGLQQRCRVGGARMAETVVHCLHGEDELSVVPCIDGQPAGPPAKRDGLWHGRSLFVRPGEAY